ncbi:hypothetical protein [Halostella salina]|nr:hypothetical protein [Halostella salina]
MPSSHISRRRFGLLGATGIAGVAGCNVLESDDGVNAPDTDRCPDGGE